MQNDGGDGVAGGDVVLLQRSETKITATLTEFYGSPALLVFGTVLLTPTEPLLRHYSIARASAKEIEALRQGGFKISGMEPCGAGAHSTPPPGDNTLF
jgi:hypothetical protein